MTLPLPPLLFSKMIVNSRMCFQSDEGELAAELDQVHCLLGPIAADSGHFLVREVPLSVGKPDPKPGATANGIALSFHPEAKLLKEVEVIVGNIVDISVVQALEVARQRVGLRNVIVQLQSVATIATARHSNEICVQQVVFVAKTLVAGTSIDPRTTCPSRR